MYELWCKVKSFKYVNDMNPLDTHNRHQVGADCRFVVEGLSPASLIFMHLNSYKHK